MFPHPARDWRLIGAEMDDPIGVFERFEDIAA
jgi:hypothetical protein